MPLTLELKNHDELFHRMTSDKLLLNNQDLLSSENKVMLDQLIMKNYTEDNLSLVPSCSCGDITGAYYVGDVCSKCNTKVASSIDDNLSYLLWLEKPHGVEKFVSPTILAILLARYKISKPTVQLVKYIMLPNLQIDKQQRKNRDQLDRLDFILQNHGIKRGYNSFVTNFFTIVEILEREFSKVKKAEKEEFLNFLRANEHAIFSNYLPFPNRIVFAIDSNELGAFIDKSLLDPINAMRRVTGIDLYTKPSQTKQARVAKSLIELAGFYFNYMYNSFFVKPGLIRKHISSTRSHFTARAVITSIPGPHRYDKLYLPWSLSCTLFREHILNRLRTKGFSYRNAVNHLMYHNRLYCPIIDQIFNEIISCSEDGIECWFQRNPSLHRGSIQSVGIVRVKTDVDDNTISMSYLIAKAFNADYDGDQMNLTLTLTKKAREQLVNFEPHHNILSLGAPGEFSGTIAFPKTNIATLSNWFNKGIEILDTK